MSIKLNVNGHDRELDGVSPDTPLLYVLRNDLALNGARYGCGAAQCGACQIMLDDRAVASCITPVSAAENARVTTVEGLGTAEAPHALQRAFIEEQAAQCGYCTGGMLISAAALLRRNPRPDDAQIRAALNGNLCRCGSQPRVLRAIRKVAAGEV
jgi:nicotinate dehydrogenase subunit A